MGKRKTLILASSVLVLMTVVVVSISTIRPHDIGAVPHLNNVLSDGVSYSLEKLAHLSASEPDVALLPSIGDKETLIKLLSERGAFYTETSTGNQRWNFGNMAESRMVDEIQFSTDMAASQASQPQESPAVQADTGGFSHTNEQVAGVSEGDIVKTDGAYIYALHGNTLRIVRADGADMELVSSIVLDNMHGTEFYLIGDRLAIVGQKWDFRPIPRTLEASMDNYWMPHNNSGTVLIIYDISERANPEEMRRISMEGHILATRVIGETVYLVTNKYVYAPINRADSELIMPHFSDSAMDMQLTPFEFDRMFYIPETNDHSYLMIGAVDISSDAQFDPVAYLGAGNQLYMSQNAIYITQERWQSSGGMFGRDAWNNSHKTVIMRFTIEGTDISYTGNAVVDGAPINQYSMDEHNGYFRIASTLRGTGTFITIFDSSMEMVGRTEPIEPNEEMKAMRFMGDMGYLVTFENTDPLFTIDLADPFNPRVLGELKIPGFSQYLNPVGDGLLLGIGRDTQEIYTRDSQGVETIIGFRDVGLKASLFDVSDPYDPIEVNVLVFGEGWAEVSHNPRSLMVDAKRGLYGFIFESYEQDYASYAIIITADGGTISTEAKIASEIIYPWNNRLLFIGNTLYWSHESGLTAYDYTTFEKISSLSFNY